MQVWDETVFDFYSELEKEKVGLFVQSKICTAKN